MPRKQCGQHRKHRRHDTDGKRLRTELQRIKCNNHAAGVRTDKDKERQDERKVDGHQGTMVLNLMAKCMRIGPACQYIFNGHISLDTQDAITVCLSNPKANSYQFIFIGGVT
jgi:hypothetical protein